MKRTNTLLAAAVSVFALLITPRGATSGVLTNVDLADIKHAGTLTENPGDSTPPAVPSIFDTLVPVSGKITAMTATAVGNYACKDGAIKLVVGTTYSRGLTPTRDLTEDTSGGDVLLRGAPVKLLVGEKTILIPATESDRFKAVLAILHAAKLTDKVVSFQAAAVPNCDKAFYAADVTFN